MRWRCDWTPSKKYVKVIWCSSPFCPTQSIASLAGSCAHYINGEIKLCGNSEVKNYPPALKSNIKKEFDNKILVEKQY